MTNQIVSQAPATEITRHDDLSGIEQLEALIIAAQQAVSAAQAFAGKTGNGVDFDAQFDCLTSLGSAARFLDQALEAIRPYITAGEGAA